MRRRRQSCRDKQFFPLRRIGFGEVRHMERNRRDREGGVLAAAAELFDLPADIVAGLPRLEMVGSRQLYLEHHTGLLAYTEEQIMLWDIAASSAIVRAAGGVAEVQPLESHQCICRLFANRLLYEEYMEAGA